MIPYLYGASTTSVLTVVLGSGAPIAANTSYAFAVSCGNWPDRMLVMSRYYVAMQVSVANSEPENRLHYPALDGLRAVALLMVFCSHYLKTPWMYTGVDLFFVLSGFLITGILFDSRHRTDRVRTFFIRRTLRIFPLYYGVLIGALLLTPVFHFHWNAYWLMWPAYLGNFIRFLHPYATSNGFRAAANGFLINGRTGAEYEIGHFWSLCVEEQFYLVWPWFVFFIPSKRQLAWLCASVVVLMPFVRATVMAHLPYRFTELEMPYSFTPLRVDALLLGGLLALLIRSRHRVLVLRASRWLTLLSLACLAGYWATAHHMAGVYTYPSWRLTWGQSVVDILCVLIIAASLVPSGLGFQLLSSRPLQWLGRISYGMYVFHNIPHEFYAYLARLVGGRHQQIAAFVIAYGCTVVIAWLSFKFFESPFLRLKERFAPSATAHSGKNRELASV